MKEPCVPVCPVETVQAVAFVDDQLMTVVLPEVILVGFAVMVAVGGVAYISCTLWLRTGSVAVSIALVRVRLFAVWNLRTALPVDLLKVPVTLLP